MEDLENEHQFGALWHTAVLVLLTGVAGWYVVYRAAIWLLELLKG